MCFACHGSVHAGGQPAWLVAHYLQLLRCHSGVAGAADVSGRAEIVVIELEVDPAVRGVHGDRAARGEERISWNLPCGAVAHLQRPFRIQAAVFRALKLFSLLLVFAANGWWCRFVCGVHCPVS
jgi:hypothetical protein